MHEPDLLRVGVATLADMARRGMLAPSHVWRALRGAARYHAASLAQDPPPDEVLAQRLDACMACEHRHEHEVQATSSRIVAGYCGRPFQDQGQGGPCGCLVTCTVDGRHYPAGKAVLASESCPLAEARW